MAKLTLNDITNFENQASAAALINDNNTLIENALEVTLSRDGTTPNTMVSDLDMNSNQILNLPAATTSTEPVRFAEFQGAVAGALGLTTTGVVVAQSPTSIVTRTVTGTSNEITVTNGDGVSGNPTLSLPSALTFTGKTITGGTFTGITATTSGLTATDSTVTIQDDADTTKLLKFQVSPVTTGTTATLSVPPSSTTLVGTDSTQTLTNKTLTSPTLTTPTLGAATATSINKVAITAPATSSTLTIPDGVTLTGPAASGTAMTLGNAETVTGVKTFNSGKLVQAGASSGSTTLQATAVASGVLTLPAATDTLVGKATTDTFTNKTFDTAGTGNSFSVNGTAITTKTGTGSVVLATTPTLVTPVLGAATATTINKVTLTTPASGSTLTVADGKTLTANNSLTLAGTDSTVMTFPSTSATIARTDAANTFTGHQTIEGVTSTGATGTGNLMFSASPTTTGTLTGAAANFSGTVTFGTGTVTGLTADPTPDSANDYLLTYDASATSFKKALITNVVSSSVSGVSSIAGNTGAFTLANGIDNSTNQIQLTAARRTLPTTQVFTSGSGTYTTPSNCLWIEVQLVGGGAGGAGGNGSTSTGGGNSTFSTFTASGGGTATAPNGGAGGAASGGFLNIPGGGGCAGNQAIATTNQSGGIGGSSSLGGGGSGGYGSSVVGVNGSTNSGAGGGGGGAGTSIINSGGGGGAGGSVFAIINSPSATYSYAVGAGGAGSAAGTGGTLGGNGAAGVIYVKEHYGT